MPFLIIPATAFVLAGGVVLAARLPLRGATERWTAALVLSQAMLTVTLLVAGVGLSRLDPPLVLALAATALAIVVVLTGAYRPATLRGAWSTLGRDGRRVARLLGRNKVLALFAVALLLALAWRVVLAVRLPVVDYDGLSYHLVTVDVWLQTNHVGRVPQRIWSDSYPANGELISLWLMLFSGNDTLSKLTNLLPIPLAGVATAGLARALGADRGPALLAGLVVMSLPVVLVKSDSTYVDNLAMALIAAAWCFGLRGMREPEPRRRLALLALAGAAIGLGAGTKAVLLVPLAVLGVAIVFTSAARHRADVVRAAAEWAAVGLPSLLLGGYWYARNLLVHGNPLWPFTFGPFEGRGTVEQLVAQPPPRLEDAHRIVQIAASWLADYGLTTYEAGMRFGGFGLAWPFVLGLGATGVMLLARRRSFLPIVVLCVPALVTLAIMPMPWWERYTLFVPVLAAALAALALSARGLPRAAVASRIATLGITALMFGSLAIAYRTANIHPVLGRPKPGIIQLVRLVAADEPTRRNIALWQDCSEFAQMPAGSRVLTDGFNLLHLVVGPDLDRALLSTVAGNADLRAGINRGGSTATHLALVRPENIAAAIADPDTFEPLGPVCLRVELFKVR